MATTYERPAENYAQTIARIAQAEGIGTPHANPQRDGKPYAVLPPDHLIVTLPTEERPARRHGKVSLRDAASFVRYVIRHKESAATRPAIYALIDPAMFLAVMDEHTSVPQFRDWRAEFVVPSSYEWKAWTAKDRKPFGQVEFAAFVEDNLPDVIEPAGAALLEMALNFEASRDSIFRSAHKLQDGSVNFQWVNQEKPGEGGMIHMPPLFKISIPVFENEQRAELDARLKYRVSGEGKLTITYELVRAHKVLEAAFRRIWAEIEKTGIDILLGTP